MPYGFPCPPVEDRVPIGSCCTRDAECGLPYERSVCRFPLGSCGESSTGTCVEAPPTTSCEGECAHVCGCDGRTYCNECEARDAGVRLAHEGPCECTPARGEDCRRGQYCLYAPGPCGEDGVPGICVERPTCPGMPSHSCTCPHEDEPQVCSCDGRVDASPLCAAARAQSLATPDRCWDRAPEMLCRDVCRFFGDTCGLAMPASCWSECLDALESCTREDAARAWACIEPGDCALGAACLSELPCASGWPGMP